jgi:hypothetical protein
VEMPGVCNLYIANLIDSARNGGELATSSGRYLAKIFKFKRQRR